MSAQWDQYILKQQRTGYTVHTVSYRTANPYFYIYPHFLYGSGGEGAWVVNFYTLCCMFLSCCRFIFIKADYTYYRVKDNISCLSRIYYSTHVHKNTFLY